ncbi:unnamed protein product [Prunus armeniaca]
MEFILLGGWLGWGSQHLSSLFICTRSPSNMEPLAGYKSIAERQKRGYFIGHKPSTQKSWRNRWCLAYGDWECPPGKTVSKRIPTHFQSIGP